MKAVIRGTAPLSDNLPSQEPDNFESRSVQADFIGDMGSYADPGGLGFSCMTRKLAAVAKPAWRVKSKFAMGLGHV